MMKTTRYIKSILMLAAAVGFASCNDFLDVLPDNRTTLDNEDKLVAMLVSAYPTNPYFVVAEYSTDNVDHTGVLTPNSELYIDEAYRWDPVTDNTTNDSPDMVWESCYYAAASANQVLDAIELMESEGKEITAKIKAAKGEALVCRAYAHFILVSLFSQAYNPKFADEDLGIPYMDYCETELRPHYDRGTVANVYARIDEDLQQGLPLVNDIIYSAPKYHFNKRAAHAFAARFYLFYQKYDKSVEYANAVLGNNPKSLMRDNEANGKLGIQSADGSVLLRTMDYIDSSHACNLLLTTGYSSIGAAFGPYTYCTRIAHGNWLNETETFEAMTNPWFAQSFGVYTAPYSNQDSQFDKCVAWRIPYLFEYIDPVAQIGFPHSVVPDFTIDETLLVRAEANTMLKKYSSALEDMNLWVENYGRNPKVLTEASLNSWAGNSTNIFTNSKPAVIKTFELPAMEIEAGTQQSLLYAVVQMRRIETMHLGLRWFDIKRFGIKVTRRRLRKYNEVASFTEVPALVPRDYRCAIQIPSDVIGAGLEANPR